MAALGVVLGAFGAHGLEDRLGPDSLAVFETGVRYHLYPEFGDLGMTDEHVTECACGKDQVAATWSLSAWILKVHRSRSTRRPPARQEQRSGSRGLHQEPPFVAMTCHPG